MIRRLTIVMYHYVRDVQRTPFPGIKARSVDQFRGQIDYIRRHYRVIGPAELARAVRDPSYLLPANALLLTFDDGYRDHYETVLPILRQHDLTGIFAPVARAVLEGKVLDVNKIHFVLSATSDDLCPVIEQINRHLDEHRSAYGLDSNEEYWRRLAVANRFDPPEVIFIKRLLQRELPEDLRGRIVNELFARYVTHDEAGFAAELYMSLPEVREMVSSGMGLASHGYDHYWLGTLPPDKQAEQIDRSLDFLRLAGHSSNGWLMTYPYGSHDENLPGLLRQRGCLAGFTTEVGVASDNNSPLLLPRLDTNDLPLCGDAEPCPWTRQVI